ncbi:MAG: outer membrane beta-barrel protein [Luteolibacter sp.]
MKIKNRFNLFRLPQLALVLTSATAMGGEEMKAPASAPISTPDWLKVSGYAAASYTYTDVQHGDSDESLFDAGTPLDAVKLGLEATKGAFSGYASLFYSPNSDANSFAGGTEAGILDAYVTYTTGDFKITGGKYLSYMGYEAFDTVNMSQLTYANSTTGGVPAYHTGIKLDYSTSVWGAGVSVSDSIRGPSFWEGDADWGNGLGYEAYVVYKGIEKLTLWGGVAYDDTDDTNDFSSYDFWASYDLTDKLTIAGEIIYSDNTLSGANSAVGGLAFVKYAFTEKFSLVGRFGIDEVESTGPTVTAPDNYKYTLSPTYVFNEHFLVRAEVSYTDSVDDVFFTGVQALVKF